MKNITRFFFSLHPMNYLVVLKGDEVLFYRVINGVVDSLVESPTHEILLKIVSLAPKEEILKKSYVL